MTYRKIGVLNIKYIVYKITNIVNKKNICGADHTIFNRKIEKAL